jgi:hypothetical protein
MPEFFNKYFFILAVIFGVSCIACLACMFYDPQFGVSGTLAVSLGMTALIFTFGFLPVYAVNAAVMA